MKNYKKIGGLGAIIAVAMFFIIPAKYVLADVNQTDVQNSSYTFADGANISGKFGTETVDFLDSKSTDSIRNYTPTSGGFCDPKDMSGKDGKIKYGINIDSSANLSTDPLAAKIKLGYTQGTNCTGVILYKNISNPSSKAAADFQWSGDNITNLNGVSSQVTLEPAAGVSAPLYLSKSSDGCGADVAILLDSSGSNSGKYYSLQEAGLGRGGSISNLSSYPALDKTNGLNSNCYVSDFKIISITGSQGTTTAPIGGGTGGVDKSSTPDACGNSGWALSWLACPVLEAAAGLANTLIGVFEGQLSFTVNDLSNGSNNNNNDSLKKAWTIFKDISSAIFVILMLVVVLSEAVSFGPFDAYTIRKMLPRLIIAVILMQISWALLAFAVNVVNDIGTGLADIMYLPFGGAKAMSFDALLGNAMGSGVGGQAAASAVGWGGILAGIGIVSFAPFTVLIGAFSAIVSLVVGLATLIFRKILIMMALVFAPVAFAAWILPGTKKYYDMWYSNFTKSLMMFPLAIALIAAGRIFAYVSGSQTNALLGFFVVLVGFFGPLFILPKSYKWGGALMTSAGNGIQGAAKKMSESPRKFLDNRREGWKAERLRQSEERVNKEEGFNAKRPWNLPLDKLRSGQWDPTLGRRRKLKQKLDENGKPMYEKDAKGNNILNQPVMEIAREASRRRRQALDNYSLKGAESEEADVKAANARVGLKIDRLDPDDQDEYARQLAAGFNTSLDVNGRLVRIGSIDDDEIDAKTGLNTNIRHDSPASLAEQRAGLDNITRLGGEGNIGHVLEAYKRVTNLPEDTAEQRQHKTEAIEMMNKFKTANQGALFKKLSFIYKNPDFAVRGHKNEDNVDRTVAGMSAEDMTTTSGVGTKTMLEALGRRISMPKNEEDAGNAQAMLDRMKSLYAEASDDITLKGRIPPDVKKAFGNLNGPANMDSADNAVSEPGNDSTPAHPDTVAPVGGAVAAGGGGDTSNPSLGEMLAQGQSANIHSASVGTNVTVDLHPSEAFTEAMTKAVREGLRTQGEGGIATPESRGTVHMPDGSEHTVPPPPPPGPRIIKPGDPEFHNPGPGGE